MYRNVVHDQHKPQAFTTKAVGCDTVELKSLIERIERAQLQQRGLDSQLTVLGTLTQPPSARSTQPLIDLIDQLDENRSVAEGHEDEREEAGNNMNQVMQQIDEWASANPTCPLCGGDTDTQRIITVG